MIESVGFVLMLNIAGVVGIFVLVTAGYWIYDWFWERVDKDDFF